MNRRVILQAIGLWLLMAVLAIANGTLRQAALIPWMGDTVAQVISIAILAGAIAFIEWRMVRGPWTTLGRRNLWIIGACWMAGTILFEFALGRLVLDMTWSSLLQQYNLFAGNLWPIIPILMLVGMPLMNSKETTA